MSDIRVVIVDDDFAVAQVHRAFVDAQPGFAVVAEAHTGTEALAAIELHRPQLVLLDVYLPDISGLEVIRRLRIEGHAGVDVIAVTAAKDVQTLRAAIHGGVLHYIVKPFVFETFRERLERYAAVRQRLERIGEASQGEIDQLFSLLRAQGRAALPKGISAPTLTIVVDAVRATEDELTAVEVAERAGISRGTARRYLEYLATLGTVELSLRYGAAGRPEHLYRWAGAGASSRPA